MKIDKFFELIKESDDFNPELKKLLDNIMAFKNPMDFDDDFATEEQLDALENEMDRLEEKFPELIKAMENISRVKASESTNDIFI